MGTVTGTDVLRVAVEGGVVKYRKNGTLLYTSSVAPTYSLLVDTALYSNGSTITNVVIGATSASAQIQWLVTDQLGTPRMIFDKTGSLSATSRHDYLPFGEEVYASTGLRTTTQGYTAVGSSPADKVRQKFTAQERDGETGLDFMHARYYSNAQGRFTSVDPLSGHPVAPQSWNGYAYVGNNSLNATDPTGMSSLSSAHVGKGREYIADFNNDAGVYGGEDSWKLDSTPLNPAIPPALTQEQVDAGIAQAQNPAPAIQPCTVQVPTDANDRAVLATIIGEAGYPGSQLFTNATNDGRANSSHEAAKHPEGTASWSDIYMEMEYMVSVFVNRHNDFKGNPSWYDIANSKEKDGKTFQFRGYRHGEDALNNLGPNGWGLCEQARSAVKAIDWIKNNGPIRSDIHFWHGVLQNDENGDFVRVRGGAIRIGTSDFW
jgi:RHS repeat-associated protein